jgi:hypothetical protein
MTAAWNLAPGAECGGYAAEMESSAPVGGHRRRADETLVASPPRQRAGQVEGG